MSRSCLLSRQFGVSESGDSPAPCDNHWDVVRCLEGGRVGRVRQPVLPLLPADATPIGPAPGLVDGADGGAVFVFGQATFAFATADAEAIPVATSCTAASQR